MSKAKDIEIKRITRIANQNAKSCQGLSEEIDRLREDIAELRTMNAKLKRTNERLAMNYQELKELRTTNAKLVERHNADLDIIAGLEEKLRIANERAIDSLNIISEMERHKNNICGAPSGGEKMIEVVIKK